MQLNRDSQLVRYWLWATFNRSEQERTEALAKGTNVCGFVRDLVLFSLLQLAIGVMIAVSIPTGAIMTWAIIAVVILCALIVGYTPAGFDQRIRKLPIWWAIPFIAAELQWRRNMGLRIGSRTLYAYHALVPLALYGFIRFEYVGWTRWVHEMRNPQPWITLHGLIGLVVVLCCGAVALAWWRKTDTWRVLTAWLKAKKDRACPRIEFVAQ